MITIIASTNRAGSNTLKVAKCYHKMMEKSGITAQLLSLTELPETFAFTELYGNRTEEFEALISAYIGSVQKFVFVVPEYNGSFPGVLKTFIDAIPPAMLHTKKVALIGVAAGRAGNLRGMDHLGAILHHLKVHVHYAMPKLSQVGRLLSADDELADEATKEMLQKHIVAITEF